MIVINKHAARLIPSLILSRQIKSVYTEAFKHHSALLNYLITAKLPGQQWRRLYEEEYSYILNNVSLVGPDQWRQSFQLWHEWRERVLWLPSNI